MFDFSQENKEKYYTMAEKQLKETNLGCFTVDRERFGVIPGNLVKIYLLPFTKKTVSNQQLAEAKQLTNFCVINDRYSKSNPMYGRPSRENAYLCYSPQENNA